MYCNGLLCTYQLRHSERTTPVYVGLFVAPAHAPKTTGGVLTRCGIIVAAPTHNTAAILHYVSGFWSTLRASGLRNQTSR